MSSAGGRRAARRPAGRAARRAARWAARRAGVANARQDVLAHVLGGLELGRAGFRSLPGLALMEMLILPPWALGSGKSVTPWARMHWENFRACARCWAWAAALGWPPFGRSFWHLVWAAANWRRARAEVAPRTAMDQEATLGARVREVRHPVFAHAVRIGEGLAVTRGVGTGHVGSDRRGGCARRRGLSQVGDALARRSTATGSHGQGKTDRPPPRGARLGGPTLDAVKMGATTCVLRS